MLNNICENQSCAALRLNITPELRHQYDERQNFLDFFDSKPSSDFSPWSIT